MKLSSRSSRLRGSKQSLAAFLALWRFEKQAGLTPGRAAGIKKWLARVGGA
jgi:hypothetical protein